MPLKFQFVSILKRILGYGPGKPPGQIGVQAGGPSAMSTVGESQLGTGYDWYQHEMQLATERLQRYRELRSMDDDDIVAVAADIMAEDATAINLDTGKGIWPTAKNPEVLEILEELFEKIEVDDILFPITRETALMGDHFEGLIFSKRGTGEPGGIVRLTSVDPGGIHRHRDTLGRLSGFSMGMMPNDQGPTTTPWEYVHWRMLGGQRVTEYGWSLFASSRRVYRRLKMMEDAISIYRINRCPDRLIFKIKGMAGLSPQERFRFLTSIRTYMRKKMAMDQTTGETKSELHPLCFTGDTKVPLLDGTERTMLELVQDYGVRGKTFWVYSIDPVTGEPHSGEAHCLGVTGHKAELVKVTLTDGGSARCTPDHKWLLRDGTYRLAKDLKPGDSLMPLNRVYAAGKPKGNLYERVWRPFVGDYVFTHRMAAGSPPDALCVHHKNFNSRDNRPENLLCLTWAEHSKLHVERGKKNGKLWGIRYARQLNPVAFDLATTLGTRKAWKNAPLSRHEAARQRFITYNKSEKHRTVARENGIRRGKETGEQLRKYNRSEEHHEACRIAWADPEKKANGMQRRAWCFLRKFGATCKSLTQENWKEWKDSSVKNRSIFSWDRMNELVGLNHSVASVEFLPEREDVYDISVDGDHNFGLSLGVFVSNSIDSDFYIDDDTVGIEKMPGTTSVGPILDVDYMRKRLCGCLRIPPDYLGFPEAKGGFNSRSTLCLTGDTTIELVDEQARVPIEDLVGRTNFAVASWDHKSEGHARGIAKRVWCSGKDTPVVAVEWEFTSNTHFHFAPGRNKVLCTPSHPWLLRTGEYRAASDLVPGDVLMAFGAVDQSSCNCTITSVQPAGNRDVYDMEVEPHHNFALGTGVFVHNSDQDVQLSRSIKRLQRATITGFVRLCQIHLAFIGMDPLSEENEFSICMNPVSYLDELQRSELVRVRVETVNAMQGLADKFPDLDKDAWLKFLFKVSGFPEDMIQQATDAAQELGLSGDVPITEGQRQAAMLSRLIQGGKGSPLRNLLSDLAFSGRMSSRMVRPDGALPGLEATAARANQIAKNLAEDGTEVVPLLEGRL